MDPGISPRVQRISRHHARALNWIISLNTYIGPVSHLIRFNLFQPSSWTCRHPALTHLVVWISWGHLCAKTFGASLSFSSRYLIISLEIFSQFLLILSTISWSISCVATTYDEFGPWKILFKCLSISTNQTISLLKSDTYPLISRVLQFSIFHQLIHVTQILYKLDKSEEKNIAQSLSELVMDPGIPQTDFVCREKWCINLILQKIIVYIMLK